jgi:cyanophycin synthetase
MQHSFMNDALFTILRGATFLRQAWLKVRLPPLRREATAKQEFYGRLWRTAAAKLGAEFYELSDGVGEIRLNGKVTRVYKGLVMLDDPVTLTIAGNKPLVHKLLTRVGLPVPEYYEFTLASLEYAERFLERHAPCVVKPALDTGAGDGVAANIQTKRRMRRAAASASLHCERLLIEKQITGDSYRLLYLDGRLLHALHRRPPTIMGDGRSTLRVLIDRENERRAASRTASVTRLHRDEDMRSTLRAQGLALNAVPNAGRNVVVKTVVNDNAQRDNEGVTNAIGSALREEGALAARTVGSRLAAVDVITTNPLVSLKEAGGVIIEVNTTPGLHHHYNIANPDERTDVAVCILELLLGQTGNEELNDEACCSSHA